MQVCAQPGYAAAEGSLTRRRLPKALSLLRTQPWLRQAVVRTLYVASTTLLSMALPFFAVILGLVGACTFYQVRAWRVVCGMLLSLSVL
jgi:hypothetical protein